MRHVCLQGTLKKYTVDVMDVCTPFQTDFSCSTTRITRGDNSVATRRNRASDDIEAVFSLVLGGSFDQSILEVCGGGGGARACVRRPSFSLPDNADRENLYQRAFQAGTTIFRLVIFTSSSDEIPLLTAVFFVRYRHHG